MKEYARKLLDKSLDTIEAAEGLSEMGKLDIAAGRAYYAMFYVAEALLYNELGLQFSQHGQVISAYGKHFSKTKILDQKYHRWLRDSFDTRISGDYDVDTNIGQSIVADMINQARDFLLEAERFLKKQEKEQEENND